MNKIDINTHILHPYDPESRLPVCTEDGRILTVHCTDLGGVGGILSYLVTFINDAGWKSSCAVPKGTLFNYETREVYWINVYKHRNDPINVIVYESEEAAYTDRQRYGDCIDTIQYMLPNQ